MFRDGLEAAARPPAVWKTMIAADLDPTRGPRHNWFAGQLPMVKQLGAREWITRSSSAPCAGGVAREVTSGGVCSVLAPRHRAARQRSSTECSIRGPLWLCKGLHQWRIQLK